MVILMKKLFILLTLSLFLFSGCMTTKRIQRHCDEFLQVCGTEVRREIHYRDTIIALPPIPARLPKSDINIVNQLVVRDGAVNMEKITKRDGLISTSVEIIDGRLVVDSWLNDSTILVQPEPVTIPDAIKQESVEIQVPVKYIPKLYKYSFWILLAEILVLIGVLVKKIGPSNILKYITKIFAR